MVPVLRPIWAFFFTKSHRRDRVRGQRRGAASGSPPSRPVFAAGEQSGPRLRAPPAGRASALAGDPSPWPAPAAFNVRRPGMAAARTAATLFKGGRCGGLLAVNNSQQRNREEAAALRPGPGGEAAVRFKQPMGPARCAHWPGRELAPCVLTPCPRPGLLPPCPPAGGGPGPDMCVRENTARAASVEFVRHRRANYARSRPQAFCRKNPRGFFDSPK